MIKRILVNKIWMLIFISTIVVSGCGKKADKASDSAVNEKNSVSSASSGSISVEIPPMSSNGVMYGVIIDATEKSMTLTRIWILQM